MPITSAMTHEEVVSILRRNRGAMAQLADSLGLRQATVSEWTKDPKTSARVDEAARVKARELLKAEAKAAKTPPKRALEPSAPAA